MNANLLAWRVLPKLPEGLVRAGFWLGAHAAWLLHGSKVRRLEANYARLRPDANRCQLRLLSRRGMVCYMRYYAEIFSVGSLPPERILARVRVEGIEHAKAVVDSGQRPVLALAHLANWDYAAVAAAKVLAPVTTVAERLEPPALFDEFCRLRQSLGMTIIPSDPGQTLRPLVAATRHKQPGIVPILADRDLGHSGIEVTWFGHAARVSPGPALLARSAPAPLFPFGMFSERLTGPRRRAARCRYGYVLRIYPEVRASADSADKIEGLTQAWVDALAADMVRQPWDWHMLQRVFVADLDPIKDSVIRGQRQ